jgi:hypothetical protein
MEVDMLMVLLRGKARFFPLTPIFLAIGRKGGLEGSRGETGRCVLV